MISELLLRGHTPAQVCVDVGYDILLATGLRLQVKTSSVHRDPRLPRAYGQYSFRFARSTSEESAFAALNAFDFAVLFCLEAQWFFVVPRAAVTEHVAGAHMSIVLSASPRNPGAPLAMHRDAWGELGGTPLLVRDIVAPAETRPPGAAQVRSLARAKWSREYDACRECNSSERWHQGQGYCFRCYQKYRRRTRYDGSLPHQIASG